MPRRVPFVIAAVLAFAVPGTARAAPATAKARASAAKLVRFASCRALTAYARERIVETGGGTGVPFRGDLVEPAVLRPAGLVPSTRESAMSAPMPAAAPTSGAGADTSFSTTNVQEAGVDEADLVKTDGRRLFVVSEGALRIFDITGPAPQPVGRLKLDGSAHQLLLRGDRLLVLAAAQPTATAGPAPRPVAGAPVSSTAPAPMASAKVLLTEVDVSTASAPRVARTMELAGRLAGARLTAGTARVIVASTPDPITVQTDAALEARAAKARTSRFLPRTTIRSRISGTTFRRAVVPCDDVRRPRAFSGLDLLSVLTIDLDKGLFDVARDAVMAGAQDVYASPTALVVASRRYSPSAPEELGVATDGGTTELHWFDGGAAPRTAYRGSGSVPGFVLNQFSMSEHQGVLRVATTQEAPFGPQGRTGESESGVTVLRPDGGRLVQVGRVSGLGRSERIYAVRFLGDRGYVVTFRQVDPLYVLDLADPAKPRVTGELKITGYSAYLHPISETLLLGVGQDASEEGRTRGPQVSLFDVADPAAPRLVARAGLGGSGSSAAEQDHHAFLWWAPARLAVLPLDTFETRPGGERSAFSGAVGFRVGPEGVAEAGRITHPAPGEDRTAPPIGRSVVVGDRLLTLSSSGIATNAVADLAPLAFTPLG